MDLLIPRVTAVARHLDVKVMVVLNGLAEFFLFDLMAIVD